jgi:hypothetical protein
MGKDDAAEPSEIWQTAKRHFTEEIFFDRASAYTFTDYSRVST